MSEFFSLRGPSLTPPAFPGDEIRANFTKVSTKLDSSPLETPALPKNQRRDAGLGAPLRARGGCGPAARGSTAPRARRVAWRGRRRGPWRRRPARTRRGDTHSRHMRRIGCISLAHFERSIGPLKTHDPHSYGFAEVLKIIETPPSVFHAWGCNATG